MIIISGAAPHPYLIEIEYETHFNSLLPDTDADASFTFPKNE
jgi:hypothetical protein